MLTREELNQELEELTDELSEVLTMAAMMSACLSKICKKYNISDKERDAFMASVSHEDMEKELGHPL